MILIRVVEDDLKRVVPDVWEDEQREEERGQLLLERRKQLISQRLRLLDRRERLLRRRDKLWPTNAITRSECLHDPDDPIQSKLKEQKEELKKQLLRLSTDIEDFNGQAAGSYPPSPRVEEESISH